MDEFESLSQSKWEFNYMTRPTTSFPGMSQFYILGLVVTCLCGCAGAKREVAPMAITPYQAGDERLSCSELNSEVSRLNETVLRLMERNEQTELIERQRAPTESLWAGVVGAVVGRYVQDAAKDQEQVYGTEAGQLIQAHQERINHLEELKKSRGC